MYPRATDNSLLLPTSSSIPSACRRSAESRRSSSICLRSSSLNCPTNLFRNADRFFLPEVIQSSIPSRSETPLKDSHTTAGREKLPIRINSREALIKAFFALAYLSRSAPESEASITAKARDCRSSLPSNFSLNSRQETYSANPSLLRASSTKPLPLRKATLSSSPST